MTCDVLCGGMGFWRQDYIAANLWPDLAANKIGCVDLGVM